MKAIILEDVKGMSRHVHSFLKEKSVDFVVVDSAATASEEYVKAETVFLHFTNHYCTAWEQCSDFLLDYDTVMPQIHIHTGATCKKHLPEEKMGVKNLIYLGDMEKMYFQMQLALDEMSGSQSKTYIEECLTFENEFTSSEVEDTGQKYCHWLRKKSKSEEVYFVDAEDWQAYEEAKNIAYMEKRTELMQKEFFQSDLSISKEKHANLVTVMEDYISTEKVTEGNNWMVYDLRTSGEVLGYVLFKSESVLKFVTEDLFFYSLNRFPRIILEKKHYQRILEESYKDDVSSLYNQKYLPIVTDKMIDDAKETGESFSVLFIDVDFFKKVNDTKGHMVGSGILCELGEILKNNIRDEDFPFRYGGDEFLLLLANTDSKAAESIAERIRAEVEAHEFVLGEHRINITLSIGIASYPEHATTKEDVIELADQAMYYGKNKSRNIVFVAS